MSLPIGAITPSMRSRAALDSRREVIQRLLARGFTPRPAEVAGLLTAGLENKDIAGQLFIAEGTVHYHMGKILKTLGVKYRHLAILELKKLGVLG
jgi:DNA-binding NarL/FixJ family response regulator